MSGKGHGGQHEGHAIAWAGPIAGRGAGQNVLPPCGVIILDSRQDRHACSVHARCVFYTSACNTVLTADEGVAPPVEVPAVREVGAARHHEEGACGRPAALQHLAGRHKAHLLAWGCRCRECGHGGAVVQGVHGRLTVDGPVMPGQAGVGVGHYA